MNMLRRLFLLISLVAYSTSAPVNAMESEPVNASESELDSIAKKIKNTQTQDKRRRIKRALLAAAAAAAAGAIWWRYTGKKARNTTNLVKPKSASTRQVTASTAATVRTRPLPQTRPPQAPLPQPDSIAQKSEATFEHYFSDYLQSKKSFPYQKIKGHRPVRSLEYIIGRLSENGKLSGHMSFTEAEEAHDWIQWAFPTQTESAFNRGAILSNKEFQTKMKETPELRNTLLLCFRYYLNFMGLDLPPTCDLNTKQDGISFVKTERFEEGMQNFLENGHNWMRVSRILESLRIHGLEEYGQAFSSFLTTPAGIEKMKPGFIKQTQTSQDFWKKRSPAVRR